MVNKPSNTVVDALRSVYLFRSLTDQELQSLSARAIRNEYQKGDLVLEEGQPGKDLHLIVQGCAQVFLRQPSMGFEKELRVLRPGDHFGEISVITGDARTASVRALENLETICIDRDVVRTLMRNEPSFAQNICKGLARYLVEATHGQSFLPFVSLADYPAAEGLVGAIPRKVSEYCRAVPLARSDGRLTVGMVDPYDPLQRTHIRDLLPGLQLDFAVVSEQDFETYRTKFLYMGTEVADEEFQELRIMSEEGEEVGLGEHETAAILSRMFNVAVRFGASDIHVEPAAGAGRIRTRIDGQLLTTEESLGPGIFRHLVSRLMIMAKLDITQKRHPQDGRFQLNVGSKHLDVRVAVTPCHGGQKAVLRVLDKELRLRDLHSIVLCRPVAELVREIFSIPSGLVLVTGPTGSGKTTTLYAGLESIWRARQSLNFVTIEDPVEYYLDFATQIQVDRKIDLDFLQILRSVLRQDPDVILVGEIRDGESASIALEAGNTGHLVLSSLHTDFTLDAIVRLRKLGIRPYLLSSALKGVVSQRLVPRLCEHCREQQTLTTEMSRELVRQGVLPEEQETIRTFSARGCDICRDRGELGRVALCEVLVVGDTLRKAIDESASWTDMHRAIEPEQFVAMSAYARYLLSEGLVSAETVIRALPRVLGVAEGIA